jgi:hypothetical protein
MALFFYNGEISRAVAFEKLLNSGETFTQRLLGGFSDNPDHEQLVHIATDGESYGHHHRFGEMALSYALNLIESRNLACLTNYGQFLEQHPPDYEVEIAEHTSWSCVHGVERWESDCGCDTGAHPQWHQAWRGPLRLSLDWLRDRLSPLFQNEMANFLKDPWQARDDYIQILLDRSPENLKHFLSRHAQRNLDDEERVSILKLLELQRHAMLMFTSCGWFFDDLSGIETIQILQYAGRAIQLARELFGLDLETDFLERLEKAHSNLPQKGSGGKIFDQYVKPAMAGLEKVGAHYAISSLFKEPNERTPLYCYRIEEDTYQTTEAGKAVLGMGRARFTSVITHEARVLNFCVLHLGDHNLHCGVGDDDSENAYIKVANEIQKAFDSADFPEIVQRINDHFGPLTYSLKSLFRDEQKMILDLILESTMQEIETLYRRIYEDHAPLMRYLKSSGMPQPEGLKMAAEFALNANLRRTFADETLPIDHAKALMVEAEEEGIHLDTATLEYALRKSMEQLAEQLAEDPSNLTVLNRLKEALDLLPSLPFQVNLWTIQNICYEVLQTSYKDMKQDAAREKKKAKGWIEPFSGLAERLSIMIDF